MLKGLGRGGGPSPHTPAQSPPSRPPFPPAPQCSRSAAPENPATPARRCAARPAAAGRHAGRRPLRRIRQASKTHEVHDVSPDGCPATKLVAAETSGAHLSPQGALGVGGVCGAICVRSGVASCRFPPLPTPSCFDKLSRLRAGSLPPGERGKTTPRRGSKSGLRSFVWPATPPAIAPPLERVMQMTAARHQFPARGALFVPLPPPWGRVRRCHLNHRLSGGNPEPLEGGVGGCFPSPLVGEGRERGKGRPAMILAADMPRQSAAGDVFPGGQRG